MPSLTNDVLRQAPSPEQVDNELHQRLSGQYLVGHNVGVDWRLLYRNYPKLRPAGLIDTLRLARATHLDGSKSLRALLDCFDLRSQVSELVPSGRPHRALWGTVAAALLLSALINKGDLAVYSMKDLLATASIPLHPGSKIETGPDDLTLF